MGSDWGNIPIDIATVIAEHLQFLEDFEAFAFVCSRWRLASKQAKFRVLSLPDKSSTPPWLMLSELNDASSQRRFYSPYNNKIRTSTLPSLVNLNNDNIRLLSSRGWLLCVSDRGYNLCVVNPFSGASINLPKVKFWDHYNNSLFEWTGDSGVRLFEKFILSGDPSTSDFVIALIFTEAIPTLGSRHEIISYYRVSFYRKSKEEWDPLLEDYESLYTCFCNDITYFKGNFYSVDDNGKICCYELDHHSGSSPHEQVVVELNEDSLFQLIHKDKNRNSFAVAYYLVEYDNQLLVVGRVRNKVKVKESSYAPAQAQTVSFKVFGVNIDNGEVKSVPDLGDVSIFVGSNSSFLTKAASIGDGIKPNSIYFTDDYKIPHFYVFGYISQRKDTEIGIFSLTDEKIYQLDCVESPHYSDYAPYMWLENPSL